MPRGQERVVDPEVTRKVEPEVTQPRIPTGTTNRPKEGLYTLGVILGWVIAVYGAITAIYSLLQDLDSGLSNRLLMNQAASAIIVGLGILIARFCGKARRRIRHIPRYEMPPWLPTSDASSLGFTEISLKICFWTPTSRAIRGAMIGRDSWEGTATELLSMIDTGKVGISKDGTRLSTDIMKPHVTDALEHSGIAVGRLRTNGKRLLCLTKITKR